MRKDGVDAGIDPNPAGNAGGSEQRGRDMAFDFDFEIAMPGEFFHAGEHGKQTGPVPGDWRDRDREELWCRLRLHRRQFCTKLMMTPLPGEGVHIKGGRVSS